ncbi:DNA sulfur modification protein DndD [Salimicrobium flavidum]|uniref:Nuclease SbcCD subunit C n=1 Tax=Salimicrobium flavidum TaxID=570947 RepID=A0A1N7JAQ7_9BACI|nr:DNA sulfur modification protein DndD [Salimicrobium flavidum]SIS46357.1 DNA sulfur modification protein DndD [Salimicrobium flavidum]
MLIKSITLENFGAYKEKNTIDLSVKGPKQNVILIGGENGTGKTTLLNAIKIALFGPYTYGLKTESSKYTQEIYNYLNTQALRENANNFQLILEFSEVENFEKIDYKFVRAWHFKNNNLKEELQIFKNDSILNESEKEIYLAKLKESMPPQLFDLCLFDGEEISRIINDNLLSSYLQRLSKVVFNLTLFENLETDLEKFSSRKAQEEGSSLDNEILSIEEELQQAKANKEELEQVHQEQEENNIELKEQLASLQKDFETHGGLYKEERDDLINQLNHIENTRKELSNEVKNYIGTILPFQLNKDLLDQTVKQLDSENSQQVFKEFSSNLNENTLHSILNDLDLDEKENAQQTLKQSLLTHMQPEYDESFHSASNDQKNKVTQMNALVKENTPDHYAGLLEKNQSLLEDAKKIRKRINTHDQTNEFTQMIQNIEQLKVKIENSENEKENLHAKLKETNENITSVEQKLETKEKERYKAHKQRNALGLIKNLIDTSKDFRNMQQQKKLHEVQSEALSMLKQLMRKQRYISAISIEAESFDISLYDKDQNELNMDKLSAGEKEILLLSLIWAMFKASGRRVPFIFDTLLGRLDKTHKSTVLSKLIPASGEQTLLLSTDTEIDEFHYDLIKPHLSHVYTLDFNNEKQSVSIQPDYFFTVGNEESK